MSEEKIKVVYIADGEENLIYDQESAKAVIDSYIDAENDFTVTFGEMTQEEFDNTPEL